MTGDHPEPTASPAEVIRPITLEPIVPAPIAQISPLELADLRRRADRYRFLFKTIVTVTSILVAAALIVTLVAILLDE